jgi:hypothetical protein
MIKEYKVNAHNSTVCGYPGSDYDWSLFDWNGETVHSDEMIKMLTRNKIDIEHRAPLPWVDNGIIAEGNEYLHVPYNWPEDSTIYRVRPNKSMQIGHIFHSYRVIRNKAVKKDDGWYWQLELEGK